MTSVVVPFPRSAPALRVPALVAGASRAAWLSADGEIETLAPADAVRLLADGKRPLVCHMPATARRLGINAFPSFDLLELFAFVRPARFCPPTPRGLAQALELDEPRGIEDAAATLNAAARALLAELGADERERRSDAVPVALVMHRAGWSWGGAVLDALGVDPNDQKLTAPGAALMVWMRLQEWSEHAPEPPPGHVPVEPQEARQRLARLLGPGAEARPQQGDYASALTRAFVPRQREGEPNMVIAEAGTGVGKTLGYIAPASLWAEKNEGAVWLSTYTRNLQNQIDDELDRLYPDPSEKARRVVVRKGRENYLCLLNFEEAVRGMGARPRDAVALGLMARWAGHSRDGDMVGGDFPSWLADVVGRGRTLNLTDRRGECVYSACPHYHKCFIEKSVRRAHRARLVVANHALVLVVAARAGDDGRLPTRIVFDEGHHLFDAADNAFSVDLTGQETAELRRWLLGAEGRSSRARGLKRRVEDLILDDAEAQGAIDAVQAAARVLPGEGWPHRINDGQPHGPAERFLALVRQQVRARATGLEGGSLETDTSAPVPGLIEAAEALDAQLERLIQPLGLLRRRLLARLDDEAAELDTGTRLRIEAVARSIERRGEAQAKVWQGMLRALEAGTPPEFVDWLSIERIDGRDFDVGMHRHWVDPMVPFARVCGERAHGLAVTSATLMDGSGDLEADWQAAEARTGARHLPKPALRASMPSPFDYPKQTRVLIVTDVQKTDMAQIAAAYRELFLAAGGGALGLFTAIARLREVHKRIARPVEAAGLPLYAQHVDGMDVSTLVDILRAEGNACLLGTDAVRDGVDVPGRALRLIVFDRVPWPRPDIMHKARRQAFGGRAYDEMLTRLRLKQAFGRLIRRADDIGVFVLLDRMMPTRLFGAFPPGVEPRRVGLAEAVRETREFLKA
ncbi:MAG: ATP-dependent DNA helicase [Alphaproteobacteria bacterium]|nr:ATP-dependent DNA helicase [Alphaproteobacteria bacterium]